MWHDEASMVRGVLLDIHGVLINYNVNGSEAIPGSIEAIQKLKDKGIQIRFCTNETQKSVKEISSVLNAAGFAIDQRHIFSPLEATIGIMKKLNLRPHLMVHKDVIDEFSQVDQSSPNCVVIADMGSQFTYEILSQAFELLVDMPRPRLFSLGIGRYYKQGEHLALDVGPFTKALEFACGIKADIAGKPSTDFFLHAVADMKLDKNQVIMIGDDIVNDVGGAQKAGIKALQVRTGKYRPSDEPHAEVTPDGYVDDLSVAVTTLLESM